MTENITVLLVEDEPDINLIAKTILRKNGYAVLPALNGQKGIEIAQTEHVDIILLDVSMPGMDGYAVIQELKKIDRLQNVPIVFFSALVQQKEIQKGLDLGAAGYIKKPFDPNGLAQDVKMYLEKSRSQQSNNAGQDDSEKIEIDKELVIAYVTSLDKKLSNLDRLITSEDYLEIRNAGHKLAGSGASYGFSELSEASLQIEAAANVTDMAKIKQRYADLKRIVDAIKSSVQN